MDPLSQALSRPEAYPHPAGTIEVVETHISRIFLTRGWAYKLKKPVNLGFLDFSTLGKRKYYCEEELRLNLRLCPEIYLEVVPVVQTDSDYFIGSRGEKSTVVDYMVKMVRFDRSSELDRLLAKKRLTKELVDRISETVSAFHQGLLPAPGNSPFGRPDILIQPMLANFNHTGEITSDRKEIERLEKLKTWTVQEHRRLSPFFLLRKNGGFIRQCHGDMHTGNMVLWNGKVCIFDCIEFNEILSIIDVISDLAFLFMDLKHGGEPGLAWRLLNNYLFQTGDYASLPVLGFYTVYRAMVRAKVTAIRYAQTMNGNPDKEILEEHRSYIRLAEECTRKRKPLLMITCGVSGSGKTTVATEIASLLECLHLRSDIERKRIAGMAPLERSGEDRKNTIYAQNSSEKTYRRLLDLAAISLKEGIPVIVDATFLQREKRERFRELASEIRCPFRILLFHAKEKNLAERVVKRLGENRDASEADLDVLRMQLQNWISLSKEESSMTTEIITDEPVDFEALARELKTCIP